MGVQAVVRRLFTSTGEPVVIHECRHCGTSVNVETDACPTCGVTEISRYEID
jgi:rubrerythrin